MRHAPPPRTPLQLREMALEWAKKRLGQIDAKLAQELTIEHPALSDRRDQIASEIKSLEKEIAKLSKGGQ